MGAANPGTKLGRYQVIKHLASGGMAEVLLARATGIEGFTRHVVIKRIRPGHADNAQFVQMFLNEARLAAQLHHQNIVQVHDIGQEGDEYFFAMEYVHGEDLRRVLTNVARRKDQVPLEHVVAIVTACAVALHHAHEQLGPDRKPLAIVHRDVSPANILVGYDGQTKLVDFGIAKAAAKTHEATVAGALKGKASYMAPEQCTGKGVIDRRTDVFALGIVLYELATARRLFKGASDFLTMSAIVAGSIPPPRSHRPDMPEELEAIILKALSLAPEDRYQTAAEMGEALEQFAHTARLRSSTTSLAAYMKHLFGERLEPWLVEEDAHIELTVDFDGSASGMAMVPTESVESNAIPETIGAMKSSPIMRARVKAATNAPPLAAVSTQKSGAIAKPRATTRQIAIPEAAATPGPPQRRATWSDSRPVPSAPPPRRKPITVQIPVAQQAAGAGPTQRASTNQSGGLPGVAVDDGVPKDIDASWDPSRPMAVADTAAVIAAEQQAKAGSGAGVVAGSAAFAATAPAPTGANDARANGSNGAGSANLANGSNGAMNAAGTAQRSAAMSDANGAGGNSADATTSTVGAKNDPAKPASTASTVGTKSDPAIAVKPASTASTVGTKSDPAIAVKPASTTSTVGTKSDPAIAVKPASTTSTVGTKSDPAIAVKPASTVGSKSDPAITVATSASKGDATPVPRGDTTPIPKGDPTPVPKDVASPTDSSSRLSPTAFGRGAAASGPAVSRTTTPLPSMSKSGATAGATASATAGATASAPSATSATAKPAAVPSATAGATASTAAPSAPSAAAKPAAVPSATAGATASTAAPSAPSATAAAVSATAASTAAPSATAAAVSAPAASTAASATAKPAVAATATAVAPSAASATAKPAVAATATAVAPSAASATAKPAIAATATAVAPSGATPVAAPEGTPASSAAQPVTTAGDASAAAASDTSGDPDAKAEPSTTPSSTPRAKLPAPRRAKLPGVADISEPRIAGADKLAAADTPAKTEPSADDQAANESSTMAPAALLGNAGADASPFAAPTKNEDSPFAAPPKSDDDAGPLSALLATKPAAAAAKIDGGDDLAARFAANAPMSAPVAVPAASMTLPADADEDVWGKDKSPGLVAKLKAQPKKLAIAAGVFVLLIVVIVMATGGDKKASKSSAGPDKAAGTDSDKNKQLGDDHEKPSPVESGGERAVADPTGSAAGGDTPSGDTPSGDTPSDTPSGDTTATGDTATGDLPTGGDTASGDTATGGDTGTSAAGDTATATGETVTKPIQTKPTKKPVKRVATKTTAKTAAKKTTTKATAKTVAKKPATTTKTTKPAVKKPTKCDPTSLFPCKKK